MNGQARMVRRAFLPRDDVPMKLLRGRRVHEGVRPAWRRKPTWPWMLAFRRQNHQENATVLGDLDATEGLITELYTYAVEQLGSDTAPTRFGGLCALERLAQDNPAQRQGIVNVICAYLRMPFPPTAAASKPEPGAAEDQHVPVTESERGTTGIGGTWQQERQVRLTAQRILAEHIRDYRTRAPRSTDPSSSRFWNNIRLDLSGATLIDFSLEGGAMVDANFHGAVFSGDASFGGADFRGAARFGGATFSGDASFAGATFRRAARFGGTTFGGAARFGGATFRGAASFPEAAFRGDALFDGAAFSRAAGFRRVTFGGVAVFRGATFTGDAWFNEAAFTGDAGFGEATFSSDAWFNEAAFTGDAGFDGTTFSGDAGFGEAIFSRGAWFNGAGFSRGAGFDRAAFGGDAWFDKVTFSRGAGFDRAAFAAGVWFGEAAFAGDAGFDGTTFSGGAWFGEATFRGGADALHFEQSRILSADD